jgi:hypothetical protein
LVFAKKVDDSYTCEENKANIWKGNNGAETLNVMHIKSDNVHRVMEALRTLEVHHIRIIKIRVETPAAAKQYPTLKAELKARNDEIQRLTRAFANTSFLPTAPMPFSSTAITIHTLPTLETGYRTSHSAQHMATFRFLSSESTHARW